MTLYWQDSHRTLYNHSCHSMPELADDSIQCCVTSPPYWGLRKYKGEQDLIWGGDKECLHEWGKELKRNTGTLGNNLDTLVGSQTAGIAKQANTLGQICSPCGAWRGAYGLEPSVDMYVQHTVEILREIRRVLRNDGVVFWNIGDSYAGSGQGWSKDTNSKQMTNRGASLAYADAHLYQKPPGYIASKNGDIKAKDLCLIPFRVAISAQADGWWVRSVIIWNKPNPMPESVTDRPTESHEYILMLTKSAKYYWDMEAVREEYTEPSNRWGGDNMRKSSHKYIDTFEETGDNGGIGKIGATSMFREGRPVRPDENGRNLRSVWTFPTQPYPGAHFATFPEKLPKLCIKASTPEAGCCSKCRKPWERIVEHKNMEINRTEWGDNAGNRTASSGTMVSPPETKTLCWQQSCKCNANKVPSTILDPFCGAGTTLKVAAELNRHAVGYELSKEYCELIVNRNKQGVIL